MLGRSEAEQLPALFLDCFAIGGGDRGVKANPKGRLLLVLAKLPGAGSEAIDEHAAGNDAISAPHRLAVSVTHDTSTISVRKEQIVVLRNKARRSRGFRVRSRRIGEIEQLPPLLVPEAHELWTQPLEDVPKSG